MAKMCNKEEAEDLSKTITNFDDALLNVKSTSRCESPVFKCINHKVRGNRLDSSEYDIPSYQVNQSTKSKTSSKYHNESSESLLPFSPIFSPFPVPSVPSQPASIVGKNCKQSELCDYKQKCSIFESLGMSDKDISWVSSMASPAPPAPQTGFNTIEKATFLPEEKFLNIQPRALFSSTVDEDFGCKPLAFSSESEEDEAYKSNIRLSDVCATLKQLEVKSFDQTSEDSLDSTKPASPVITTKKKKEHKKNRKKEKPNIGETSTDNPKSASSSNSLQNFVEDDSFQSLSFSGIDELCKTLVNTTETDLSKKSIDLDKTIVNSNTSGLNIQKHFYSSKTKSEVYEVTELDNLHSHVKALEEVDLNIPPSRIDKSLAERGIITLDLLDKQSPKPNTKRLHSDLSVDKNENFGKKLKMDNDSNWDKMREYLSESQLNVNENEIFKTVENLEKTLASQEAKESENTKETIKELPESAKDIQHCLMSNDLIDSAQKPAFITASGAKISIGKEALTKANKIFLECDSENMAPPPVKACKTIKISSEALEKAKTLMLEENNKKSLNTIKVSPEALEKAKNILDGTGTSNSNNTIKVSPEALEKGKELICGEGCSKVIKVSPELFEKAKHMLNSLKRFPAVKGKKIKVSDEALEKAKALMLNCNESDTFDSKKEENLSKSEKLFSFGNQSTDQKDLFDLRKGFSTGKGKKINVSSAALEKAKALMASCNDDSKSDSSIQTLSEIEKIYMFGNASSYQELSSRSEKELEIANSVLEKDETLLPNCKENNKFDSSLILSETEKLYLFGNELSHQENTFGSVQGFSTVGGNKINVSSAALEKAKTLMASCTKNDQFDSPKQSTLSETENIYLFGNDCTHQNDMLNSKRGFSTDKEEKIDVSSSALEEAKASIASCSKNDKFNSKTQETLSESERKFMSGHESVHEDSTFNLKYDFSRIGMMVDNAAVESLTTSYDNCTTFETSSSTKYIPEFSTGRKLEMSDASLEKDETCDENSENLEESLKKVQGFVTGSGKRIEVSEEALKKGKVLMESCDETPRDLVKHLARIPKITRKTIPVSFEALEKAKTLMQNCNESSVEAFSSKMEKKVHERHEILKPNSEKLSKLEKVSNLNKMQGFLTGTGKTVQVSAEALEKAKNLLSSSNDAETSKLGSTNGVLNKAPEEFGSTSFNWAQAFTTGTGKRIEVSNAALEKAKTLLSECDQDLEQKKTSEDSRKIHFMSGNGKRIEVSNEALEKAKALMSSCEEDESSKKFIPSFTTGTGRKVEVSREALEKAKTLVSCEEESSNETFTLNKQQKIQTFRNPLKVKKEPSISSGVIKVEKASIDQIKIEKEVEESLKDDFWLANFTQETIKEQSNSLKVNTSTDETIPSWLHVYTTSPSLVSEKQDSEDQRYVKSPVLGSGDRFYKKVKRKKLKFEDEADRGSKTVKRTSSSLDFSAPFKKVCLNVKKEREKSRLEQEKIAKEKQKVKPIIGSHLRRKNSRKQMSWSEAVEGCSPGIYSKETLRSFGVMEDVQQVAVDNAAEFTFNGYLFFGASCENNTEGIPVGDDCLLIPDDDNNFGVEEFKRAFLASPGVQPNLLPSGWIENHYKWIVWKLAHYEKSFPQFFGGKCLTPNNVMLQLKYRYDREIDRNERSALKKILERDDTSMKRMVLCVCGIKKVITGELIDYELTLTDGWYSCPARSDLAMKKQIEDGKVTVGTKLVTVGATLINCDQGISPLELTGDVYLKIFTNSTRRIRWDTKLGFQKNPESIPISLGSILPQGGPISQLDVIIVRVYPLLYMEKTTDGHHITRNARSEEKAATEYQKLQERRMESICNELQSDMQGGSSELTKKLEQKLEKEKLNKRNVSEFFRVKIVDLRKPDYNNPALLSVWNPNEEVVTFFSEGRVISLKGVSASSRSHKPLQLNTTRQTHFKQIPRNVKYPARQLTRLVDVSSKLCPVFEEVDLVGVVIRIQDVSYGSKLTQVIYLTDLDNNFVGVVFWGNCKDYGWENVLTVQSVVACSNLQWKKNYTAQEVPSLHACENSVFTENPKLPYLKEELERLRQMISQMDKTTCFTKCEEELTQKLSEAKWPKTKLSKIENGFESKPTASSTPIKPFPGHLVKFDEAEPSPIQKRIEKLQCYGEPPPLMPLPVKNPMRKPKKS